MNRINIYILVIFLIVGCTNNSNSKKNQMQTTNDRNVFNEPNLKLDIIENGNSESYETLSNYYMDYRIPEELLFYSLIMSNDFNNAQASYDVFSNISLLYKNKADKISANMAKMAIDYLLKASELGHHQAIDEVKEYSITAKSDPKNVMIKMISD
jgi:hypothetical protein